MSGGIRKGAGRKASPIDLIAPETDESIAKGRRAGLSVVPRRSGAASDISTSTPAALLSAKQQEAIEALLLHGTVEDAARETFITIKKLSLWMKNPAFMAAYLAAKRAEHRQSLACLAQGPLNIVRSLLQIMYHGKKPATRLKAARKVISMAGEGIELEEFAAAVAEAEGLVTAAQARGQPAGAAGKTRTAGHGAKLPRRMEQAITALLGQPSVAEAARTIGVKPATLRLWMENPAFIARYAEAALGRFRTGDEAGAAPQGSRGGDHKELFDRSGSPGRNAAQGRHLSCRRGTGKCDYKSGIARVRDGAGRR